MASFMVSLLEGDDTMRARGNVNIKGKPVSRDPLTPLLADKARLTCGTGSAGCGNAGFGSARIALVILEKVIHVGVCGGREGRHRREVNARVLVRAVSPILLRCCGPQRALSSPNAGMPA